MKKHLLLILALLAFILPARAQSDPDMLYNFKNNSTSSDYGTNFNTSVDIDNVIANVTGVYVTDGGANAKNYVSAITEATNVAYNSKGGVYMKAGGKLTFTLKKGYKVTGYQFMGQQLNGTTATITLNGISFDGPTNTQAEGQFSRLYPVPSSVTTVNSITISSNKDVYIKSVGIYIEADASTLTVNVAPPAGSYKVGQVVMASANNTSANVQMIISKIEGNNYTEISKTTTTGYNSYTFSEAGKYQVIAQAYTGNWQTTSNYFCEEYTIVGDEPDPTPATLSVNLATGTYKLPQTVTITSSKADDDIIVILTDENEVKVVNNTFTGSWTYNFTTPGTFALSAHNNDESTISEIYEFGYAPETPVFSKDNGAYTSGTEITVSSKYATQLAVKVIKKADYDANGFSATGTKTIYDADSHTLTLSEDVVIVAQGKNDFGTTSTDYRIYTIKTPDPCPIEITPAGTNITTGTEIKVASSVSDATLKIMVTKDGETFVEENFFNNPYTFTPTEPGTYIVEAVASATGYTDNSKNATYTVTAPVHNEVAPKISFSPEDQKVFGSEEEIDVTLTLNHDVYPVPNVIYYTLDGFMAHNTLETGTPGATPAGHVHTVAVDPSTLSGTVRIERSHREVLNHRAVTINAYTFNTAGSDVAAATYIFNDNAAPLPDPEPTTITATVTMANQGWTSEKSPYTNSTTIVNWTSKLADGSEGPNFSTKATAGGPKYYSNNGTLRIYSGNVVYVTAPEGYVFVSANAKFSNGNLQMKPETVQEYSKATSETAMVFTRQENAMRLRVESGSNAQIETIEYVLAKANSAAKAAVAHVNTKTATNVNTTVTFSTLWSTTGTKYTDGKTTDWTSDDKSFTFVTSNTGGSTKPGYFTGKPAGLRLYDGNKITVNAPNGYSFVSVKPTSSDSFIYDGVEKASGSTITFNSGITSFTIEPKTAKKAISKLEFVLAPLGGSEDPTVETPEITLSTQAKPSDPVTVTIDCATEGATVTYTVKKDGNTVADNLTYDPANKPVFSEVGSYTVNATASKEGMNPANATPANFTIEKLVEVVEELFFVMDQNLWDVDGAYPETVVPFEYKGNNTYDLDITKIPAKGWYMNKNGIWTAIEHGFRGNFYVRDGKANHKGLVFGATGTVADATFATRAAAAGNQMVEPHTKYNMYVVNMGETHKVFTTIDDDISKAFSAGTIRVTHTPGNKDASKTMTLEILAEDNQTTGVDSITAEDAASDANARFFNLQGVEVPADRLAPGIYIRQAGSKATKVLVK